MTKYIVKNCPAFISKLFNWQQEEDNECLCTISPEDVNSEMKKCEDLSDCPIKQVVKIYAQECPIKEIMNADDNEMFEAGRLAKRVLQTLQVEEVE